jgi:hypothetical protein
MTTAVIRLGLVTIGLLPSLLLRLRLFEAPGLRSMEIESG